MHHKSLVSEHWPPQGRPHAISEHFGAGFPSIHCESRREVCLSRPRHTTGHCRAPWRSQKAKKHSGNVERRPGFHFHNMTTIGDAMNSPGERICDVAGMQRRQLTSSLGAFCDLRARTWSPWTRTASRSSSLFDMVIHAVAASPYAFVW